MADEQQEGVRSGNVWGMGGGEIIFKFKECRQMVKFYWWAGDEKMGG